jgi:hypothetical protein
VLSPLPCWAHLSPEAYRQQVTDLVEAIESEAATGMAASGRVPLGVEGVLRQNPETRPVQSKRSPAPLYHAASRAVRKAFWEAYAIFVAAFWEASERLRAGDRMARFPIGSFPPGLPFFHRSGGRRPTLIAAGGSTRSRFLRCAQTERKEKVCPNDSSRRKLEMSLLRVA